MNIFFTSDFHLGHDRIRQYCNRPFSNLETMDETIIKNCNSRIKEDDLLFFLGDFCFKTSGESPNAPKNAFLYYRNQLKCKNIIFLKGNHDKHNSVKSPIESMILDYGGHRIYLTHNPQFYRRDFEWNFCGHTHGNEGTFRKIGKSIIVDLSVDCWSYRPVEINEIHQAYSIWLKTGKK